MPVSEMSFPGPVLTVLPTVFIKVEKIPDYKLSDTDSSTPPSNFAELSADTLLATRFTMVAIDSATLKSVKVNSLKLLTPADHRIFRFAEDSKARKRRSAEISLSKTPPTQEERLFIHDVYLQYSEYDDNKKPLPKDMVWMEDTRMESNYIMQPQDRNIHNNIFGGYVSLPFPIANNGRSETDPQYLAHATCL